MPTLRGSVLAALHTRLSALPATALCVEELLERAIATELLILRDGSPGLPEVTLPQLAYQRRAAVGHRYFSEDEGARYVPS